MGDKTLWTDEFMADPPVIGAPTVSVAVPTRALIVPRLHGVTHRWMFRDRERSRPASSRIQVVSRFCLHLRISDDALCEPPVERIVVAEGRCPRSQCGEVPGGHPGEVLEALLVNTASRCASLCAPDADHFASPTG